MQKILKAYSQKSYSILVIYLVSLYVLFSPILQKKGNMLLTFSYILVPYFLFLCKLRTARPKNPKHCS